jgi:hypothetical protein
MGYKEGQNLIPVGRKDREHRFMQEVRDLRSKGRDRDYVLSFPREYEKKIPVVQRIAEMEKQIFTLRRKSA